jgi:hypothetical protein
LPIKGDYTAAADFLRSLVARYLRLRLFTTVIPAFASARFQSLMLFILVLRTKRPEQSLGLSLYRIQVSRR